MPNIKSAKKALRSDIKKRVFNLRKSREMKDAVKIVRDLMARKNNSEALKALPLAYKKIDKAAKRGIIKKNTADRKKSRLAQAIKKMQ